MKNGIFEKIKLNQIESYLAHAQIFCFRGCVAKIESPCGQVYIRHPIWYLGFHSEASASHFITSAIFFIGIIATKLLTNRNNRCALRIAKLNLVGVVVRRIWIVFISFQCLFADPQTDMTDGMKIFASLRINWRFHDDSYLDRLKVDSRWRHSKLKVALCRIRIIPSLISKR